MSEINGLKHSWLQTTAVIAAVMFTAAATLVVVTRTLDASDQRISILEEEHREDVQAIANLTKQLVDVNAQMSRINDTAAALNTSMQLVAQKLNAITERRR